MSQAESAHSEARKGGAEQVGLVEVEPEKPVLGVGPSVKTTVTLGFPLMSAF